MSISDSDEAPDELSFSNGKNNAEEERAFAHQLKLSQKKVEKLKRRLRNDMLVEQKRSKEAKQSRLLEELREEQLVTDSQTSLETTKNTIPSLDIGPILPAKKRTEKKSYKGLNIEVRTLKGLGNDRGAAALNFKLKRLAKVPRESSKVGLIHKEKLAAAGKL